MSSIISFPYRLGAVRHARTAPGAWLTGAIAALFLALLAVFVGSQVQAAAPVESLSALDLPGRSPQFVDGTLSPMSAAPEWRAFEEATGHGWRVTWNAATGLPRLAVPANYDAAIAAGVIPSGMNDRLSRAATLDASAVDRMSRHLYEVLQISHPSLPPWTDLSYLAVERRGGVWWAMYGQNVAGVRIEGARADFRYSDDGKLLYFGLDLIPTDLPGAAAIFQGAPGAALDGPAAEQAAISAISRMGIADQDLHTATPGNPIGRAVNEPDAWVAAPPPAGTTLVNLPVVSADGTQLEVRPAWLVRTEVTDPPARFASWVDAITGDVLRRENEYRYGTITGHSDGDLQMAEPTDPYVILPMPNLRVTVSGVGDAFTDAAGDFSLATPDEASRTVTSALSGSFGAISDAAGTPPFFQGTAVPGTPFPIHWSDTVSDAAERDSYYHVNVEHAYIKAIDPSFNGTDYEMPINVNLGQTCNAYWDGYAVNFFHAGGGCANTGQIPDVVYHEYGHGVTQFVYAPASASGSEHEGFSDYIAASMTDQPLIGRGFTGPGTWLRTCDNNRQWPAPECGGEVHCEGEVIAGALWHMRQNLVARLGHDPGVTLSDHLFHFARYGRQSTYEGYYFDVLAADDDNGTLIDGTPHAAQIIAAFHRHNIGPGWTLEILHTPLHDSEGGANPYPVNAVFSSPANLQADSLAVYYTTMPIGGGPADGPHRLGMIPTGNLREYQALIPSQPLGTRVRYYIAAAADTLGLTAFDPPGAPGTQHEFLVQVDSTPPTVSHDPLFNKSAAIWPVFVQATVTDNQAVASVLVEWKRGGSDQPPFVLNRVGESDLYRGQFNAPVLEGDHIQYRIKASDGASTPNVSYLPALGYFPFVIVHNFAEDAEHGTQDWTHDHVTTGFVDQWNISTRRSHGGTHAWYFGDNGSGVYADGADGALITPPITLGPSASLAFWHWINAESQGANQAWDGAVVEISTNAGTTWNQIAPVGGYTHTIIANPASPFPPGTPCWSGAFNWRQAQFDLAAFTGQTVQVRLRFGSDGAVTFEGWYIDDLVLNPGQPSTGISETANLLPTQSAIVNHMPSPMRERSNISFTVAPGDERVRLAIVDVTGRRVRTLAEGQFSPGLHNIVWDGRGDDGHTLGRGVYFARLHAGSTESAAKLLLVK